MNEQNDSNKKKIVCSEYGWEGTKEDCQIIEDYTWEHPMYSILECPECFQNIVV